MINTSGAYKEAIVDKNRILHIRDKILLKDGTVLNLTDYDFLSCSTSGGTAGMNSFDLGGAVIGKYSAVLNNADGRFDNLDFSGGVVTAYSGLELKDGTEEILKKGVFTMSAPVIQDLSIKIEALDNMSKFDRKYTSTLSYPATIRQIVQNACADCGVTLATKYWENDDYIVENRPDDEALTYREVLSWAAQICCKYARCNANGALVLDWYEKDIEHVLTDEDGDPVLMDGNTEITAMSYPTREELLSGDLGSEGVAEIYALAEKNGAFLLTKDGKRMLTASSESSVGDAYYHKIDRQYSLSVGMSDIRITGAGVEYDGQTYLRGTTDYALVISGNGFIQNEEQAKQVAIFLYNRISHFWFRTFSGAIPGDPSIEAGDCAYLTDRKGNHYLSYITNATYSVGGAQRISCGAETPEENQSDRFSVITKAIAQAKKETEQQLSSYNQAVQALTSMMAMSLGAFKTTVPQEDGSAIYYMHNKRLLEESDTIWKMAADAFAVSTDGGETWNAGIDSQGNVIVNVLSAIGIRCDWLRGGTATFGGENNVNGSVKVLDSNGNVVVALDNKGAAILGSITSKNAENGFSARIDDGELTLTDKAGKDILKIYLMETIVSGNSRWVASISAVGSNPAYITLDGETGGISVNGTATKSGRAEFSDGSYLTFTKGFLTGGKTASGATF